MHEKQTNKNGKEKFVSPYSPDNTEQWRKIDTEHQTYSQCNKSAGQTLNTQIPGLGSCVRLTAQGSFCVQTGRSPISFLSPALHPTNSTWGTETDLGSVPGARIHALTLSFQSCAYWWERTAEPGAERQRGGLWLQHTLNAGPCF